MSPLVLYLKNKKTVNTKKYLYPLRNNIFPLKINYEKIAYFLKKKKLFVQK